MSNQRRNLAIQIQTPGGDNPLLVSLVSAGPYYRGVAVSGLALVGKGGTAPYAYSIIATSSNDLPPGLSVDPLSGQITGTPSLAGHFSFIAQVSDSASATFTHSFSITILAQLFWRGPPPPKGEINVSYNYQFRVFDAAGTLLTSGFTYDGTLPAGLTLSTGGLLSGTPTAPAGISYATVHATDGTDTLDIPIAIEIAEAVNGYYLEDRDPPDGWGGGSGSWLPSIVRLVDWSAHLVITGGVGPYSVVDSETDPPPTGITINNSRSRILGGRTADAASTDAKLISVIITDAIGATKAIQRATLIIDSQQPRITPRKNGSELSGGNGFTNLDLVEGDNVSIEAANDGNTTQYRISAAPGAGGGIGTIAGVGPDSSGNLEIEGIVEDPPGHLRIDAFDGGGIQSISGATPDSSGNLAIEGIEQDSNGVARVSVLPSDATKGDILVFDGTHWGKHDHGADGQIMQFDASQSDGIANVTSPAVPFLSLGGAIMALSPMAFWKLSETSGTTFADSSGNGYDLTNNVTAGGGVLAAHYLIPTVTNEKFAYFGDVSSSVVASRSGTLGFTAPITGDWSIHLVCAFSTPGVSVDAIRIGGVGSGGANNNAQAVVRFVLGGQLQAFWHQGNNSPVQVNSKISGSGLLQNGVMGVYQVLMTKDSSNKLIRTYVNGRMGFIAATYSTEPTGGSASSVTLGNSIVGTHTGATFGYMSVWDSLLTADDARDLAIAGGFY